MKSGLLVLVSVFAVTLALEGMAASLNPADGKVEFHAVGRPSAIKINGEAKGPKGDIVLSKNGTDSLANGTAEIALDEFTTGMALRDRHMKEKYFETAKFPTATLTLKDVKVPAATIDKGGKVSATAELSLHGVTKTVNLELQLNPQKEKLKAMAEFKIKISDFGIDVPKFSGITVADEVTVRTETVVLK